VRPRRIAAGLAAVQREALIDDEDDEDDVQPPAADTGAIYSETRSFAEFAEALGAEALPDLLEAAAAYAACIEGRPHVSRPQLMRQVQGVLPDNGSSREDSLRGFGTLLRNGRIVKVRRGQYAISAESNLLAKARRLTE